MDHFNDKFDRMMDERMNRANTIAANLGVSSPLEKSISQTQFDDQYGKGYDVFEKDALERYIADVEKSVANEEETIRTQTFLQAGDLIKSLQPVIIRTGETTTKTVFARPTQEDN